MWESECSRVEADHQRLRAEFEAGALSREGLEAQLQELMLQDERGQWWMIGTETGRWYRHDGDNWVPSDPRASTPIPAAPSPELADSAPRGRVFVLRLVAYLVDLFIVSLAEGLLLAVSEASGTSVGILPFLMQATYCITLWSVSGQTPGKMLTGIRVVSADGSPITFGKAFVRYLGYLVATLPLGLGLLWALWDDRQQGWHDHLAGTRVILAR